MRPVSWELLNELCMLTDLDNQILKDGRSSPLQVLQYIRTLNDTVCAASKATGVCSCRFMCEPGNCTSYSSTNYLLAGLVLAGKSQKSL